MEDATGADDLGPALAAIAAEGQRMLLALQGDLALELTAAIDHARRQMSKGDLAALIAVLKRARQSAAEANRRRINAETTGRQAALKRARRRVAPPPKPSL